MSEAFEIGVTLALSDGVSAGMEQARKEMAQLERVLQTGGVSVQQLRAASTAALSAIRSVPRPQTSAAKEPTPARSEEAALAAGRLKVAQGMQPGWQQGPGFGVSAMETVEPTLLPAKAVQAPFAAVPSPPVVQPIHAPSVAMPPSPAVQEVQGPFAAAPPPAAALNRAEALDANPDVATAAAPVAESSRRPDAAAAPETFLRVFAPLSVSQAQPDGRGGNQGAKGLLPGPSKPQAPIVVNAGAAGAARPQEMPLPAASTIVPAAPRTRQVAHPEVWAAPSGQVAGAPLLGLAGTLPRSAAMAERTSSDPKDDARAASVAQSPAAPPAQQASSMPIEGDVFLDGALVGRWMSRFLTQQVGRASAGPTGFDPKRGRLLPGPTVGS